MASETSPPHSDPDAENPNGHFSDTIEMRHWLSLLVVTATVLLLLATVAAVVHLLAFIGHTLLIFALGGLLAYALDPLVERVRGPANTGGKRRSRATSALLVFLVFFVIVGVAGAGLSRAMSRQVELLAHEHQTYEANLRSRLAGTDDWLRSRNVHVSLSSYLDHPPANVKTWGEAFARNVLTVLGHLSKAVIEGVLVVLIALYFLIYCEEMREGINRALPPRLRAYAEQWESDVNTILGGFVRGQAALALTIGTLAAVLCLLMGLRLWLLIGLFVTVAALVPVVGPVVGAVPAVIAALISPHAQFSPVVRVVILIIGFVIINEIGSKILYPRLVGAALGLHEVLVLFALLAGYDVGGLVGVLFAAPLTALALVTLPQLYRLWQGLPPKAFAQSARQGGKR